MRSLEINSSFFSGLFAEVKLFYFSGNSWKAHNVHAVYFLIRDINHTPTDQRKGASVSNSLTFSDRDLFCGCQWTVGEAGGWPRAVRHVVRGFNFANLLLSGSWGPAARVILDQCWEPVALPDQPECYLQC